MLKIKTYLLLFSVLFFFFPFISFAQNNFDYRVMEGIPGVIQHGQVYTFNQYISAVYSFAIWAVGIAALLMISIGAFMYLTSAGNNAAMSSAKGVITDALIGLVLAMLSWLLLYIINPDLVSPSGITGESGGAGGTPAAPGPGGTIPPGTTAPTRPTTLGAGTSFGLPSQVPRQNGDASSELANTLTCMSRSVPNGQTVQVSSISDNNGGVNCYRDHPNWSQCNSTVRTSCCFHARNSCHYGGTQCPGSSYAADLSYRGSTMNSGEMAALARNCGARYTQAEGNHLHMSVGNCGCN